MKRDLFHLCPPPQQKGCGVPTQQRGCGVSIQQRGFGGLHPTEWVWGVTQQRGWGHIQKRGFGVSTQQKGWRHPTEGCEVPTQQRGVGSPNREGGVTTQQRGGGHHSPPFALHRKVCDCRKKAVSSVPFMPPNKILPPRRNLPADQSETTKMEPTPACPAGSEKALLPCPPPGE